MLASLRLARPQDLDELARMRNALWPESSVSEHRQELLGRFSGKPSGTMPLAVIVAEADDQSLIGFLEVGLRSHADGCDPATPVGFIEGWYVSEAHRRQRVGAQLMIAAEGWARGHGCTEMASDTWLDSDSSQRAHEALGFQVVDRCVHYRKKLSDR